MAGETALARQLSKLAVPQTSLLLQDKIRKSFLFDHRDAAALDRDVFYSYGTTGLDKLKIINPLFEKFEQSLFSVLYMGFERSVQTASVNTKLDAKIVEFLRLLSPYFLTDSAHQALEWLVYRFHIHLYNADELVASVLPHYYTSTFVRVVQLLNLENPNNRWAWLKPLQKSGVHLEFGAILNRFNTDGEFRKLVCNLAPNSFKVFKSQQSAAKPIISFSMCTILGALGRCGKVTDSTITFLFPYILKGLKSNYNTYVAASYSVISKIIEVVQLKDELVTDILMKVFQNLMSDREEMSFKLLLNVFQRQPIKFLTKELFLVLLSTNGFLNCLVMLSEDYDCTSLLAAIIKRSIPALLGLKLRHPASNKAKKLFKFVAKMLRLVVLSDRTVLLCFNVLLNSYSKLQVEQNFDQKTLKKAIKLLLKQLETSYPSCFDKAITQYFKKKNIESNNKLLKLINNSVCSVKNELVPRMQTTLVLGINHANPKIRQFSTRYLLKRAGSDRLVEMADADFVGSSMYERLFDDSTDVVYAVLSYPKTFFQFVEKKKALLGFKHILNRKTDENINWYPAQMACLDIICDYFADEEDLMFEIFVTVLPFLFPLKKASIKGFVRILNSKLNDSLPVVQVLEIPKSIQLDPKSKMTDKQLAELNCAVFSSTRKYIEKLDNVRKSSFVSYLIDNENSNSFLTLYVYAVGHAIISFEELDQKEVCVQHMFEFLKSFSYPKASIENAIDIDEETLAQQCVDSLHKQQFPGVVVYYTFYKIVKFIKLEYSSTDAAPWELQDNSRLTSFNILTKLLEFCLKKFAGDKLILADVFKSMLSALIDSQFQTPQHLFGFLSSLWSNALENVPVTLQTAALTIADEFCKSSSLDWFFENYAFCISLLKAIASLEVEIRKSSLALLSSLLQCSKKYSSPLKYLAEDVNGNSEEIIVDHRQCFYLLNNWLAPAIVIYGRPNYKSILDSDTSEDLQKKYSVLDNFIQLLASNSTVNSVKYLILLSLQETDSVGVLTAYIPVINCFLQQAKENDESLDKLSLEIIDLLLQKFSPVTASALQDNSIETENFFKYLEVVEGGDSKCAGIQMSVLKVLTREFFTAIPSIPVQKKLLKTLLNIYMNSSSEIGGQLKKVLSKLCTFVYLILKDFQKKEETAKKTTTLREVKKSRIAEGATNTVESKMWKQITVLLEIIQNKAKLDKRELLIPELFNLLNKTLNFDNTQSSVEYVRQLILSSIYNCCQHLGREGLDERQFQVELIVQCIRSSTNPKTHHQSLLLLNLAATIFPDYVLNNVMSIFTFMGSSLIRQDDSYSIQVISQTIETIVPSLLAASNFQEENEAMQIVSSVIRVFVDSLSDIPRHRQLPLFSKLITTLEPSKYLWVPLAQICDQYATVFHDMTSEDLDDRKLSPTLEFAVNLHKQFSPSVQVDTCINLLQLLSQLPNSKEESGDTTSFKEPFDVANHTDQQLQIYKYNILSYINIWLSSQSFVSQVSELDSKAQLGLEEKYETLLEKALHYLQHQRDLKQDAAQDNRNRYSLFSLLYELVGHINALLPCSLFIRVVRRLLRNPESVIKKKAIELLNCKLEQQQHLFTEENHASLLKLLNPLLKVVQEFETGDSNRVENSVLNQQTALYALHLLTKLIGSAYPKKFHKVLNLAVRILKDNQNQELTVNALLCLAQLCVSLNVKVLPHLNTFMPIIVDLLTDYRTLDLNDCLILGIITALQSLVENLGMFLSVYMQSLVTGVCMLSTKYLEANKKTIQEKLLSFQTLLAKDVSLRVMLTALEDSYSAICSQDPNAVVPLMHILEKKLGFCNSAEVESSLSQLEKFYILVLSFRSSHSNSPTARESISLVETSIISALKSFVVKVSVTRFRLFFQRIYQWVVATEDSEEERLKVYTFYSLTNELSKTLKSLFIVAAKYFLKHAASELDSNNSSKNEELKSSNNTSMVTQLLSNILDTLNTCFVYDDGHLLDKDSFDCLLQPLVDQLNNLNSDETVYQERISNHLNSCIAHFMVAVSDNTLWKKLNYQILLKTRHDSPVVRFAAIQTIREVVTVMGDNYLVLLPESIPFLAEVMEDESSEVEHECQSVIEEMEKILGEPIRKYF